MCFDAATGDIKWSHSLMEGVGRLTFPNGRTGAPVVEGDTVIVHCITANWGAAGPANDRFYSFDKRTGELVWFTSGGLQPKDSSHSTPFVETRYGRRVMYSGTGDGNLYAFNARTGEPLFRFQLSKMGVGCSPVDRPRHHHGHPRRRKRRQFRNRPLRRRAPARRNPRRGTPTPPKPTARHCPPAPKPGAIRTVRSPPPPPWSATASTKSPRPASSSASTSRPATSSLKRKSPKAACIRPRFTSTATLYCPVKGGAREGGGVASFLHVFKLTPEGADAVQSVEMDGECNAQPAVANGLLYVAHPHSALLLRHRRGQDLR
jgi:hypothetical protein